MRVLAREINLAPALAEIRAARLAAQGSAAAALIAASGAAGAAVAAVQSALAAQVAEAQAAAALARAISEIEVPDDLIAALTLDNTSLFQLALETRYARTGRPTVLASRYPSIKAAIAALPSTGGDVIVPEGRFWSGNWVNERYMAKPNVRLMGVRKPRVSANADRLEAGSIIEGTFPVFADGFEAHNIGVDVGKYVVDTRYGGADTHVAGTNPDIFGGYWDGLALYQPNQQNPLPDRRGIRLCGVIGMLRDPFGYGHGVLVEGVNGGWLDDVTGIGGIHGFVIKSCNIRGTGVAGYGSSGNRVIIKSDTYCNTYNIQLDSVHTGDYPPDVTPHWVAAGSPIGVHLNLLGSPMYNVQLGKVVCRGGVSGLGITGDGVLSEVHIDTLLCESQGVSGINKEPPNVYRFTIGSYVCNNAAQALRWVSGAVFIDSMQATNMGTRAIHAAGTARILIKDINVSNAPYAWFHDVAARILISGTNLLSSVGREFENDPPALNPAFGQLGGNSGFSITLGGRGVRAAGLIIGTGVELFTIPAYLRPPLPTRYPTVIGNNVARGLVIVGNDGTASIDQAYNDYVTLDSVEWRHY